VGGPDGPTRTPAAEVKCLSTKCHPSMSRVRPVSAGTYCAQRFFGELAVIRGQQRRRNDHAQMVVTGGGQGKLEDAKRSEGLSKQKTSGQSPMVFVLGWPHWAVGWGFVCGGAERSAQRVVTRLLV